MNEHPLTLAHQPTLYKITSHDESNISRLPFFFFFEKMTKPWKKPTYTAKKPDSLKSLKCYAKPLHKKTRRFQEIHPNPCIKISRGKQQRFYSVFFFFFSFSYFFGGVGGSFIHIRFFMFQTHETSSSNNIIKIYKWNRKYEYESQKQCLNGFILSLFIIFMLLEGHTCIYSYQPIKNYQDFPYFYLQSIRQQSSANIPTLQSSLFSLIKFLSLT